MNAAQIRVDMGHVMTELMIICARVMLVSQVIIAKQVHDTF